MPENPEKDEESRTSDFKRREQKALEHYDFLVKWYDDHKKRNKVAYWISYTVSISFSGLTPILVLWSNLPEPIKALPAALAAISVGLNGIFQFHEYYRLFAWASLQFTQEKSKYLSRASEKYNDQVDDEVALSNFIQGIDDIIQIETSTWLNLGQKKNLDDQEILRELRGKQKQKQNGKTGKGG